MSIIQTKEIITTRKGSVVSKEYKLWGIPLWKNTYIYKGTKEAPVRVYGKDD